MMNVYRRSRKRTRAALFNNIGTILLSGTQRQGVLLQRPRFQSVAFSCSVYGDKYKHTCSIFMLFVHLSLCYLYKYTLLQVNFSPV
jgi:hypothetical protein